MGKLWSNGRYFRSSTGNFSKPYVQSCITVCKILFSVVNYQVIVGVTMIPIEVSRIIEGSLNRGTVGASYLYPNYNADKNAGSQLIMTIEKNFVETDLAQEGIVPFSATAQPGFPGSNFPIQDKYIWPWSHPALLFSLVVSRFIFELIASRHVT